MAFWIKATADKPEVVTPANGKIFTLAEMQKYVGGYIEALHLNNGLIMWLNEEGKLKGLPYNIAASYIALSHSRMHRSDRIVGDVLLAAREETEDDKEEEN